MRSLICAGLVVLANGSWASENPDASTCGTEIFEPLLGQDIAQVEDQFPEEARILAHNSVATQDFRPERLNVSLDEAGKVVRLWCG